MIHFDILTLDSHKLKIGIDQDTDILYVAFNNMMDLFNFSMLDKTVDDVTMALLQSDYRNHIYIDETECFEDHTDYVSKQLWVDVECLKFLRDESEANRTKGVSLANDICKNYRREGKFFDEILEEAK